MTWAEDLNDSRVFIYGDSMPAFWPLQQNSCNDGQQFCLCWNGFWSVRNIELLAAYNYNYKTFEIWFLIYRYVTKPPSINCSLYPKIEKQPFRHLGLRIKIHSKSAFRNETAIIPKKITNNLLPYNMGTTYIQHWDKGKKT